jgi:hypothetical protein
MPSDDHDRSGSQTCGGPRYSGDNAANLNTWRFRAGMLSPRRNLDFEELLNVRDRSRSREG